MQLWMPQTLSTTFLLSSCVGLSPTLHVIFDCQRETSLTLSQQAWRRLERGKRQHVRVGVWIESHVLWVVVTSVTWHNAWHNVWQNPIKCNAVVCFSGSRNNSMMSHSAMAPAGGNQSLISAWLSGDSSKGRLETTHMLPSQTLSVNSLDVLGQYLVCGTDGEAIFVNRQVPV